MTIPRLPFSTASPLAPSSPPSPSADPGTARSEPRAPGRGGLRPAARGSRAVVRRALGALAVTAALCAAAAPSPARAETNLYNLLGGWSKHFGTDADLNQTHWGVGLEVEHEVGSWTVGGTILNFSNSYSERSTYIGPVGKRCFKPGDNWRTCLGLTIGIINGYDARNDGGFAPIASAVADVSYRAVGASFVCGPTLEFNAACLALVRLRLPVPKRF